MQCQFIQLFNINNVLMVFV